jgi:hypothetical protein
MIRKIIITELFLTVNQISNFSNGGHHGWIAEPLGTF